MAKLDILQFPCLNDNFGVLIHDPATGATASIDAPEVYPIQRALTDKGWTLSHILSTHHHADHTQGNLELKEATGCTIVGPADEAAKIPGLDVSVGEGDVYRFGSFDVHVIATPGHTLGHIAYFVPEAGVAFVGDTLFALGCGRIFEGTPEMMYASLQKLAALPGETEIYCGHEYTLSNAKFALTVEPGNEALARRMKEIEAQRAAGRATLPTTMARELETNPFLRSHVPAIRQRLGMADAPSWQVFAEIRERKNRG